VLFTLDAVGWRLREWRFDKSRFLVEMALADPIES
jgi:hypothetical protein